MWNNCTELSIKHQTCSLAQVLQSAVVHSLNSRNDRLLHCLTRRYHNSNYDSWRSSR